MPVTFVPACVRVCLLLRCIGAACIFPVSGAGDFDRQAFEKGGVVGEKRKEGWILFLGGRGDRVVERYPFLDSNSFFTFDRLSLIVKERNMADSRDSISRKGEKFPSSNRMIRKLHNKYIYMGNIAILCKKGKKRKKKRTVAKVTRY